MVYETECRHTNGVWNGMSACMKRNVSVVWNGMSGLFPGWFDVFLVYETECHDIPFHTKFVWNGMSWHSVSYNKTNASSSEKWMKLSRFHNTGKFRCKNGRFALYETECQLVQNGPKGGPWFKSNFVKCKGLTGLTGLQDQQTRFTRPANTLYNTSKHP